jgi:hypothetical protein
MMLTALLKTKTKAKAKTKAKTKTKAKAKAKAKANPKAADAIVKASRAETKMHLAKKR